MLNEYNDLKNFWDNVLKSQEVYTVTEKFIEDDRINQIFTKYINDSSIVLDFGCGSGWALPEIYLTKKFKAGIGLDQSSSGISLATEIKNKSLPDVDISYIVSDDNTLNNYVNYFDFVFSCNTLDVVPNEVMTTMLDGIYKALKTGGYALICLNPAFEEHEITDLLQMEKRGKYYFKNGIMRCNYKHVQDWVEILGSKLTVIEYDEFYISKDDKYKRRYYLLKK